MPSKPQPPPTPRAELLAKLKKRALSKGIVQGTPDWFSYVYGTWNREIRRVQARSLLSTTIKQRKSEN